MKPLEYLDSLGICTTSITGAIQDVRRIVEDAGEDGVEAAADIIRGLVQEPFEFLETGNTYARLACQHFVRMILWDPVRDSDAALEVAQLDAVHFIKKNKWMFAGTDADKSIKPEMVKAPKKLTLYEQATEYIEQNPTAPNKQFVNHFVQQLGMSKSGAQSYSHNIRSKLGMIHRS